MDHTERRRLRTFVHVPRGEGGRDEGYVAFGPDDAVPVWAAAKIGEHCWADGTEEDAAGGENIVTTSWETGLLAPSSTPRVTGSGHRSQTAPHGAGADKGLAEAERRFGKPGGSEGTGPGYLK